MSRDVFADGYVRLCIDPSLNSLLDGCSYYIEGQYVPNPLLAQPIVADKPIVIETDRDIDAMFGAGSVLAESLKIAFCKCPSGTKIVAVPRLDAAGGTKAVYTMTVTGPATTDGTLTIFMGLEKWMITARIYAGNTADEIAATINSAIPASFPYVATVAANVITLTAKNAGTVGNYLAPVLNWAGRANYWPAGVSIATARTVAGAGNPAPINYANALGTCCFDCYALLTDDVLWQEGLRAHIADAWDCTKGQCFGHGFTYNSGTAGQVIATFTNSAELSRLAYPTNDVNFPYLLVADQAATRCCSACDTPELSIQGRENGLLSCNERPASCSAPWSVEDAKMLMANGFVVYGPAEGGQGTLTSPYIYNDITNWLYDSNGRRNVTFDDVSSRYLAKATAVEIATELQKFNGMGYFTINTKLKPDTKGTNPRLVLAHMIAWAKTKIGDLFSEFDDISRDITIQTDFEKARKCQGVPGRNHMLFRYRPPVRIRDFFVTAQPKILDNCDRSPLGGGSSGSAPAMVYAPQPGTPGGII